MSCKLDKPSESSCYRKPRCVIACGCRCSVRLRQSAFGKHFRLHNGPDQPISTRLRCHSTGTDARILAFACTRVLGNSRWRGRLRWARPRAWLQAGAGGNAPWNRSESDPSAVHVSANGCSDSAFRIPWRHWASIFCTTGFHAGGLATMELPTAPK